MLRGKDASLFLSAGWNADKMTGAYAAVLNREIEAKCLVYGAMG